jgi:uncharacterized membrane protein YdfJ with MMPL/SSD domain
MVLLGRSAWWLPHWLQRVLPPISIEGEAYFEALDAARARKAVQPVVAEPAERGVI